MEKLTKEQELILKKKHDIDYKWARAYILVIGICGSLLIYNEEVMGNEVIGAFALVYFMILGFLSSVCFKKATVEYKDKGNGWIPYVISNNEVKILKLFAFSPAKFFLWQTLNDFGWMSKGWSIFWGIVFGIIMFLWVVGHFAVGKDNHPIIPEDYQKYLKN